MGVSPKKSAAKKSMAKKASPVAAKALKKETQKTPSVKISKTAKKEDPVKLKKQVVVNEKAKVKEETAVATRVTVKPKVTPTPMPVKADRPMGAEEKKWMMLYEKSRAIKTKPYDMNQNYKEETAIEHKTMGWGYIISSKDNRIEVLFREGVKILVSGRA